MRWILFAFILVLHPRPVYAHPFKPCFLHEEMILELEKRFDERPVGWGLSNAGELLIEMTKALDGSFSLIVTFSNGLSCMLVSGTDWQDGNFLMSPHKEDGWNDTQQR